MSHYSKIETQIVDQTALIKALKDVGYSQVEIHGNPVPLYGYMGDQRPERANVVVRRKHISNASNDIGFVKSENGTYRAIVSEYDQQILGADWVEKVCKLYAYHAVVEKMEEQGFVVEKQEGSLTSTKEKVHLVLKRRQS
jgi:predicted RNA binding protein YcfA (HicA-like mRNA interferase family)